MCTNFDLELYQDIAHMVDEADAVLIGAGAGLSTAAGLTYAGPRFEHYFSDFAERFGIQDMYSGGFYPFPTQEIYWAWWSRHIWVNRYSPVPTRLYEALLSTVADKDHFVISTNVDACFERTGFDDAHIWAMQGDYGLLQEDVPSKATRQSTFLAKPYLRSMLLAQGFSIGADDELILPEDPASLRIKIPTELIPHNPSCPTGLKPNLHSDASFVVDAKNSAGKKNYEAWLAAHKDTKLLLLELGVGMNTPGIIKIPFVRFALEHKRSTMLALNKELYHLPDSEDGRILELKVDIADVIFGIEKLQSTT